MDAGLFKLSANQTALDTNGELIVFNSTLKSCSGVSLSAGAFTLSAGGPYLVLGNFDFTRTAGSVGFTWVNWYRNPLSTPELYGGQFSCLHPSQDASNGYAGGLGPSTVFVQTGQDLTLGPCVNPASGLTYTANSAYTSCCIINFDRQLASSGLYDLSATQTNVDTVGEQIIWNRTLRACSGVTLSSGAFTFASGGLYIAIANFGYNRTSGTGNSIGTQWTTDSTGAGTTAYATAVASRCSTGDGTANTGSNSGPIAVVDTTGGAVTIGTNVESVPASTVFQANTGNGNGVMIMRLT